MLSPPARRRNLEGFLFPATYDFLNSTTNAQLVRDQLAAFCENWSNVNLAYARSKNLTDYDVLVIASMIEKETVVPAERKLVSAVIYNRLHARMPLGIDATLRYGLNIPPTQSILESQLAERHPLQHAQDDQAAADADREPGPGFDRGGGASCACRLPLLRAQARQDPPVLHCERERVRPVRMRPRVRLLNHVALLGSPVAHSLSPRMQNAAFAALGLDWDYTAFDVADPVARGRRAARRSASPART